MLSRGGGRARPSDANGVELFSWYFFRVSGLLLVILALLHVVIMHVVNTVDEIDYKFVADRWDSPFWKVYDFLLLTLALLHGLNGARVSIEDYVRRPGWRVAAHTAAGCWRWHSWSSALWRSSRSIRTPSRPHKPQREIAMYHRYDALVIGAGGAGLMAAAQLAGCNTAVITKLYPPRSHTGARRAASAPHWATSKKTIGTGTCSTPSKAATTWSIRTPRRCWPREAIDAVYELEHMGLPFNRTPEGKIDQRRFGGHTRNFGEAPVRRACYLRRPHRPHDPPDALPAVHQERTSTSSTSSICST